MNSVLVCPVKINITLRILGKRDDGYHELVSAFWRKNGAERLTIHPINGENINDELEIRGAELQGENLLTKTLRMARVTNPDIPPLRMELDKAYPAGSGIGAGSGDAAALIRFLQEKYGVLREPDAVARLGADVAFLADGSEAALAAGIGDQLTPMEHMGGLTWVLAFPEWPSGTASAYAALDELRARCPSVGFSASGCIEEAREITARLRAKERVGLLPNDFIEVAAIEHGDEYRAAFDAAAESSLAWGLCGSGSAFFAVCADLESAKRTERKFTEYNWVIKTAIME